LYTMTPMSTPREPKRMMTANHTNTSSSNVSYSSALTNTAKTVKTVMTQESADSYTDQKIKEVLQTCEKSIALVRKEITLQVAPVAAKIDNYIAQQSEAMAYHSDQIVDVRVLMMAQFDKMNDRFDKMTTVSPEQLPYQSPTTKTFYNNPPMRYPVPPPMQYHQPPPMHYQTIPYNNNALPPSPYLHGNHGFQLPVPPGTPSNQPAGMQLNESPIYSPNANDMNQSVYHDQTGEN
jgi:hypothetical protein